MSGTPRQLPPVPSQRVAGTGSARVTSSSGTGSGTAGPRASAGGTKSGRVLPDRPPPTTRPQSMALPSSPQIPRSLTSTGGYKAALQQPCAPQKPPRPLPCVRVTPDAKPEPSILSPARDHGSAPSPFTVSHRKRSISASASQAATPIPSYITGGSSYDDSSVRNPAASSGRDDSLFLTKPKNKTVIGMVADKIENVSQRKKTLKQEEKRFQESVVAQTSQQQSQQPSGYRGSGDFGASPFSSSASSSSAAAAVPTSPFGVSGRFGSSSLRRTDKKPDFPPPSAPPTESAAAHEKEAPAREISAEEKEKFAQRWKRLSRGPCEFDKRGLPADIKLRKVRVHRVDPSAMAFGGDARDTTESAYFRSRISKAVPRKVAKYVMDATNEESLFTEMTVTDVAAPEQMPQTILLRFFCRQGSVTLRPIEVNCQRFQSLLEAMLMAVDEGGIPESILSRSVIRIHGQRRYAIRQELLTTPLENFCHVRECILRKRLVEFVLEPPPCTNMQQYLKQPTLDPGSFGNINAEPDSDCTTVMAIPISSMPPSTTFRLFVLSVDMLLPDIVPRNFNVKRNFADSGISFSIGVSVFYNHTALSPSGFDENCTSPSTDGNWSAYVDTNVQFSKLPRESHFLVTLFARQKQRVVPVAWAAAPLFDENGFLRSGLLELRMWRVKNGEKSIPLNHVVAQNPALNALKLLVRIDSFADKNGKVVPVFWDHGDRPPSRKTMLPTNAEEIEKKRREVLTILAKDGMGTLTEAEKWQMWRNREYVMLNFPDALPTVLMCAKWEDASCCEDVSILLSQWPQLQPVVALVLLGPDFIDTAVRTYAVRCLGALPDEELIDLLSPLVQALKYDQYYYSALAEFLLVRALRNRLDIGQTLYWLLQSETHVDEHQTRYALLSSAYLWACGSQRYELTTQLMLVKQLAAAQQSIREWKPDTAGLGARKNGVETFVAPLAKLKWPKLSLPTNSSIIVSNIVPETSRLMKSAMMPLWVEFSSSDPVPALPTSVIFKVGDDLRQDMIVLNAINIMDKLWKRQGLDLRLSTFHCIPTGRDVGFVEVVPNSQTMAKIQRDASGLTGALRASSLKAWVEKHNSDNMEAAVMNFTLSCAGYCVATYVLGIGDRHNDNIMVDHAGHLFHIDFAFFMGKIVKFGFYEREKAPFVLTNEMATLMGGVESKNFQLFVQTCCNAFLILRQNAVTFFNLFAMMASSGLAELADPESMNYLRSKFCLEMSDEEAQRHFITLIFESLKCKTTLVNFFTHTLANWNK